LTPKLLVDFVNSDGNVLLALSGKSSTSSAVSSLLLELDLHISPDRSSAVVDHFNYDVLSAAEKHDVLLLPRPSPPRPDLKPYFSGDGVLAFPRPVGQSLGNASPLLAPILRAPETAYSYNVKEDSGSAEDSFATGSQLALVSTLQGRNSARFTVLGSVEALEDKWFSASVQGPNDKKASKTANREFAKYLTAWTFQEIGVLKVGKVEHYLTDKEGNIEGEVNPIIYRIKNDIVSIPIHKNFGVRTNTSPDL
jgi:oligosaccharyltransferase complex subunit beta